MRRLAARVTVCHDPALDDGYPAGRPARVRVVRADGSELTASADLPRGDAERAVEEISEEIVTDTMAAGSATAVREAIDRFYAAGCTRVLLAAYPRTTENISMMMNALAPSSRSARMQR